MKNMVIKGLVLLLGVSSYFAITEAITIKQLEQRQQTLEQNIQDLEDLQQALEDQITDLQTNTEDLVDEEEIIVEDTCLKLHEITIRVVSVDDQLDQSYTHCTNEAYLGDTIDEVIEELQVVYDPRYDKDYVYGRLVVSFYGVSIEYEEYFQITIDGVYSNYGLDYIEIEDETSYEFTVTGWS